MVEFLSTTGPVRTEFSSYEYRWRPIASFIDCQTKCAQETTTFFFWDQDAASEIHYFFRLLRRSDIPVPQSIDLVSDPRLEGCQK